MWGRLISATVDTSKRSVTERWHIQREGGGPLCSASLSGRVRTAKKATPNCSQCKHYDDPSNLYLNEMGVLEQIDAGELLRPDARGVTYYLHTLMDYDYVRVPKEFAVITKRGQVVLDDWRSPAPWYDSNTRIWHARKRLHTETLCGENHYADMSTGWLKKIADVAKEKGRTTVNCVRCAVMSV